MTKQKTIIIHADEAPSVKALVDSISRLKKDYQLLSQFRGVKDIENPESFWQVISFLEMFLKKGKRKLVKDSSELSGIFKVSMTCLADLIDTDPKLAKQIMEETNFLQRITAERIEVED